MNTTVLKSSSSSEENEYGKKRIFFLGDWTKTLKSIKSVVDGNNPNDIIIFIYITVNNCQGNTEKNRNETNMIQ